MNQERIGKLIAELRKEKNLTQEELGKQLGLTAQSISKWERGISLPDILLLPKLCEILEIKVEELINGKRNISTNSQIIIDGMKLYEDNAKKKYFKKTFVIFSILITIIVIISLMYSVNNYNKIKIYNISSANKDISLNGRIIFNPKNKIIMLNKIIYNDIYTGTDKEIMAKSISIKLKADEKIIFSSGSIDLGEDSKIQTINKFLEEIDIDVSTESDNDTGIDIDDLDNIYIIFNYIDINNNEKQLSFKLKTEEEFSNSNIFYRN